MNLYTQTLGDRPAWPTAPRQAGTPRRRVTLAAPGPHTTPAAGQARAADRRRTQ